VRPRIAITTSLSQTDGALKVHVPVAYPDAVSAAGGLPVVLAPAEGVGALAELLDGADGLILAGGPDLDPAAWGEPRHPEAGVMDPRRQQFDLGLLREAEARGMPVLGICLGCQEMAVHRGGRLVQHLYEIPEVGPHGGKERPPARHAVAIEPGSLLARIVGPEPLQTNSTHHQAIREPGQGMRIVARCGDGILEAIEDAAGGKFFLGVQWHPESLCPEPRHLALFRALCAAAEAFRNRQPPCHR